MQLAMQRNSLNNVSQVNLGAGYAIRSFASGDETGWDRIIGNSFDMETGPGKTCFTETMAADTVFAPHRVLFVIHVASGQLVATASAWFRPEWGQTTGYLHFVGTLDTHRGKGLGYWVSCAALHTMVSLSCTSAVLETDDFRTAAIITYLRLGFAPLVREPDHIERWNRIFSDSTIARLCPGWEKSKQ